MQPKTKMINRISDLPRTAKTFEKRAPSPLACPGGKRARAWQWSPLHADRKSAGDALTVTQRGPTGAHAMTGAGTGREPRIVCVAHLVLYIVPYQGRLGRVGPNRRTLKGRMSFGMGGGSRKGTNFGIQGPASWGSLRRRTRGKGPLQRSNFTGRSTPVFDDQVRDEREL